VGYLILFALEVVVCVTAAAVGALFVAFLVKRANAARRVRDAFE
jgi:hypothetical protein